jgi:excisionase family DNA binding protein
MEDLLSTEEVATILGIEMNSVARLARDGHLSGRQVAGRWIFYRSDVEEFAKAYSGKVGRPRQKRK